VTRAERLIRQRQVPPWHVEQVAREDVPAVPDGAEERQDDYGHRDVVYDCGRFRWRYRDGVLKAFFEYHDPRPDDARAWAWKRMWTDGT
jgi:hypothetical protein